MTGKKFMLSSAVLTAFGILGAPAAIAQESTGEGSRFEEVVVVTAQRRDENLQEVPVAVTALNATEMEDRQVADVLDLQFQVPNINMATNTGTANAARIFLRGVGEDESRGAVDQAVGIYVDGVYIGRSVGSLFDIVDLAQIEVLRGPQGTLYGRNTVGGAIKLTSVKPQMENSGDGRVTFGNNGRMDLRGTGNLQLGENTAVRITGLLRDRDGFHTQIPNGALAGRNRDVGRLDINAFRGALLHDFGNGWSINIAADNTLDRSDPIPDSAAPPNDRDNNIFTIEPLPGVTCLSTSTSLGCFSAYNQRSESRGVSVNISGELAGHIFTSVTGYRELEDNLITRIGSPFSQQTDQDQLSQEFTLASTGDGPFNYVLGAYFWQEDLQLNSVFVFPFTLSSTTDSYSIFGHGSYDLSDRLSLSAGLRFTSESKDFSGRNLSSGLARNESADFDNVSYTVGADFKFTDDVLAYAKYATGFKSGGWSPDAFSATSVFLPVREETLDSFEVGLKSELFDNRLRANLAYFFNDYTDLQIGATVPGLGFTRFNVEGVQIQGVEFEGALRVTDNFEINGNLGLLDAEYTDLSLQSAGGLTNNGASPGCGGVVSIACAKNLQLKNAPEYKGALGFLWTVPAGAGAFVTTGDVNFEDKSFSLVANAPPHALIDVPTLYNARIKYESDSGWSIALWGKNLSDEEYYRASSAGSFTAYASEPRTYGVDFGYKF
jgi:iron complex outermembrane recepter protein